MQPRQGLPCIREHRGRSDGAPVVYGRQQLARHAIADAGLACKDSEDSLAKPGQDALRFGVKADSRGAVACKPSRRGNAPPKTRLGTRLHFGPFCSADAGWSRVLALDPRRTPHRLTCLCQTNLLACALIAQGCKRATHNVPCNLANGQRIDGQLPMPPGG